MLQIATTCKAFRRLSYMACLLRMGIVMQEFRPLIRSVRPLAGALLAVLAMAVPAHADSFTFNFTSGANGYGTTAPRVYTVGGLTVTARALSYYSGQFNPANLGKWDQGLAVCNGPENSGGCQSGEHQVTNDGEKDFVLFEFSGNYDVDPTKVKITTTNGNDLDATYWTGTGALPTGLTGGTTSNGSGTSREVSLTSGIAGWLLFGAKSTNSDDGFKIEKLVVDGKLRQTPEPASLLLFGAAGAAALWTRRRRGRV